MIVDIWSDIRCPFCYIGKRKFEQALEKFPYKEQVEVKWHSFELDPKLETDPGSNTLEYFTRTKGVSTDQARQMFGHATQMAKEVGLEFYLEDAVPANSFNAHRLIQLAITKSMGDAAEEFLFKAHFTEKKNIDDKEVLKSIGVSLGMDDKEVEEVLASDAFEEEVKKDQVEARKIGVQGVPFFVLNKKYGISGAQSSEVFLETLEKAWEEYSRSNASLIVTQGDNCSTDGNCN